MIHKIINMKTKKKGAKSLQKFTDFESIQTKSEFIKFKEDFPGQRDELYRYLYKKLNESFTAEVKQEGDIDMYYSRIIRFSEVDNEDFTVKVLRRERWYANEAFINTFINNSLFDSRILPSVSQIAMGTGLSRMTVHKHLQERRNSEYYSEKTEMLRGMTDTVLAELYKIGIRQGNVKALNAFLNFVSPTRSPQPSQSNTQNNYIQINGMILSQENIKQLNPEQLQTIENILKGSLTQQIKDNSTIIIKPETNR